MAHETMTRGDRKVWSMTFTTASGDPYDLTGCTVWFTLKRKDSDDDDDALIAHYWTQAAELGLSRTDPDTGVVAALSAGILYDVVSPAESRLLTPYLRYPYDVQILDVNGDPLTLETGTLRTTPDITQRTTTP